MIIEFKYMYARPPKSHVKCPIIRDKDIFYTYLIRSAVLV